MFGKILALLTLCSAVLLSALLQSTSPSTIHPLGILVVFVLLYVLALGVLTFLIYAAFRAVAQLSGGRFGRALSLRQCYYYASVLALAPVLLVGMRSIGHGNVYDGILIFLFEIIACFYIAKRYK